MLLHTCKRRTALGAALVAFGVDHVLAIDTPYGQSWVHLRTLAAPNLAPVSLTAEIQIHQPRLGKVIYEPEFLKCSPSFVQPSPPLGKAGFAVLDYLSCKGQSTSSQLIRDVKAAVPDRILSLIKELSKDGYICRSNPGGKGVIAVYDLTPAGKSLVSGVSVLSSKVDPLCVSRNYNLSGLLPAVSVKRPVT